MLGEKFAQRCEDRLIPDRQVDHAIEEGAMAGPAASPAFRPQSQVF
jgi:hypothetical protein